MFSCGEWTNMRLSPYIIHGIGIKLETVVVVLGAAVLWWYTFATNRQYCLNDGHVLQKWDPDHFSLTFACLISPVHAILIIFSSQHPFFSATSGEESKAPWISGILIATAHAYFGLLAVHLFLQREDIQKRIFSGVYAAEVTFRQKQQNLRRQVERQIFEKVGQPS